MIIAISRDYP